MYRLRFAFTFGIVVAALATAACSSPPQADIETARAAVAKAAAAQADEYAPDAFKAAQDAQAQLDAELNAQGSKFALTRSYAQAEKLAAAARDAGDKAAQDAAQNKQAAKTEATTLIADARTALEEAETALSGAPRGKGTQADIEALKSDLSAAKSTLGEAEGSLTGEHYLDAKAKAEAAKEKAGTVKAAVEQAIQARKGARRRG